MSQGPLSRRRFLYQTGALAVAGGLATRTPISALAAQAESSVTLNFTLPGGSTSYLQAMQTIVNNYSKLHHDISFEKVTKYNGKDDYKLALLASIAAGNPADVTVVWDSPVGFGVQGAVEPIDKYMAGSSSSAAKNWPAAALASCQFGGQTWGLPATAGSTGFFYNEELFQKKGIPTSRDKFPKTWDELRKLSKEFTLWKGDKLVSAGKVPMFGEEDELMQYVWPALNGGQIYDAAHQKYTIDSDANVATYEYMLSWLNEEYRGDAQAVDQSSNWLGYPDKTNRPSAFALGNNAILEQGSWYLGDFYTVAPKFQRFAMAGFPVGPHGSKPTAGFWPNWVVIPQGSKHIPEAFAFMDYLVSTGVITWFNAVPDMPANKRVPLLLPSVVTQKRGKAFAQDAMAFFQHQLNSAIPLWNSPVTSIANDQLIKARQLIMYKKVKPKQGLADAQQACQAALKKALSH
jgi:multiple sugar transport system substrate-binding protein